MIIQEAKDLIKRWEGLRLKSYQDTGGVWTIGWGHTRTARPNMEITEAKAEELFEEDLAEHIRYVKQFVKVPLNEYQLGALASFVFNIGPTQFSKSTLLKKLNQGLYEEVPAQLQRWVFDNGKRLNGLVNRRAAEAGLWARESFVSSSGVPAEAPKKTKEGVTELVKEIATTAGGAGAMWSAIQGNQILAAAIAIAVVTLVGFFIYKKIKDD